MNQQYTSANTSINSTKLPISTKHINWDKYRGKNILDIGGGKFNNLRDYLKKEYNINLYVYDKYNRSKEENIKALSCNPSCVICNNVLNVICEDMVLQSLIDLIEVFNVDYYVSVYEGNKSSIGRETKPNCYQRNMRSKEYLPLFKDAKIKYNIISNCY